MEFFRLFIHFNALDNNKKSSTTLMIYVAYGFNLKELNTVSGAHCILWMTETGKISQNIGNSDSNSGTALA